MSISSAVVAWEAVYDDGHVYREAEGGVYGRIERHRLRSFRLVAAGEVLLELPAIDGRTGWNLAYRRRTIMTVAYGRQTWFVAGWVPMGPVYALQPETLEVQQAKRLEPGAGPLGLIQPRLHEGEHWDYQHIAHGSDALLRPHTITLPSGFQMKVGRG